jgi:DNA repair exonuclease SbcCD ATPase subunit
MTHEEEIAQLKEQLRKVLEQLGTVSEQLSQVKERESQLLEQLRAEQAEKHQLQESLAVAHKRIEELGKQKTPPPTFVKAKVKKPQAEEKQPRKKRDAKYNRARRREEPTQIVEHLITSCPVCSGRLGGVSVARRRPRDRVGATTAYRGERACGLSWLV